MKHIVTKLSHIPIIIFFSLSFSEPPAQSIKGLYTSIPNDLKYLSPVQGYILIKTDKISHLHHLQKKFENSGFKTPLLELIKMLFHAPLKIIKTSDNMRDKLTYEIIAAIIMKLPTHESIENLKQIVTQIINNPQYKQEIRFTIPFQNYMLHNIPRGKEAIQKALKEYEINVKKDIINRITIITQTEKFPTELKRVTDLLVELALQSAQGVYPLYFAHQILLSFMWLKTEIKSDLKRYFDALQTECAVAHEDRKISFCFSDRFLFTIQTILAQEYSDKILQEMEQTIDQFAKDESNQLAIQTYLIDNYEKINALFGYLKDSLAPLVSGVAILQFGDALSSPHF